MLVELRRTKFISDISKISCEKVKLWRLAKVDGDIQVASYRSFNKWCFCLHVKYSQYQEKALVFISSRPNRLSHKADAQETFT